MGDLGLTVALEGLLVGLGSKSKWIKEAHRFEGTRKVLNRESVDGSGGLLLGGRGESGGGASKESKSSEFHVVVCWLLRVFNSLIVRLDCCRCCKLAYAVMVSIPR
jgi:hypothetical protein